MTTTQPALDWKGLLCATQTLRTNAPNRQQVLFPPDSLRSINQIARQRLGDETFAQLNERWADGAGALALCKAGDLARSGEAFAYAHRRLSDLAGEAHKLAEVLYCSKVAYYQYRTGQFAAAEASVERVLAIDDELHQTYYAFHSHKLHVLQNMSRTLAFRKHYDKAADLVLNILQYIIAPQHHPRPDGNWGPVFLHRYAEIQPISTLFEFTFFDFCRDCFRFPALETAVVLRSTPFIKVLRRVASQSDVYRIALDWFVAKRALYVRGNASLYIRYSTTFLNGQPDRYDVFKLLLLWDAARVAKLLDQPTEKVAITSFINDYYDLKLVS